MTFDRLLHTPELAAFRAELRDFLRDHLPSEIRAKAAEERMDLPKEDQRRWHKILLNKGWVCPSWPREHGGPDWDDAHQYVFERELALADAPRPMVYGTTMLGPTLIRYGSDRQKAAVLPRIRAGEDFWCQGFSEANAGSDLAALQSRAVRRGDRYIVNGAKMWTSEAHIADRMFGLFRTDSSGKKQHGITFLLVDMGAEGVEVAPIRTYDGSGREINQVFFTDVEVPLENRVGEEHGGWTVAKHLLGLERFGIAEVSRSLRSLRRLKEFAAAQRRGNRSLLDDADFARRIAQAEIGLRAVELTELRLLFGAAGGGGAEASLLKLRGTELQNEILELMYDAVGLHALVEIGDPE
ncbi:MAG: acyl-CoA dehydrogenase family protein, partial [Dongiaceae bacterium]